MRFHHKLYIFFILFQFFIVSAYTQTITIGPENNLKGNETLTEILGQKDGVIYIHKSKSDIFKTDGEFLEKFNLETLENIGTIPLLLHDAFIEVNKRKLKPNLETAFIFQNRLHMFLTAYDRIEKKNIAYVGLFDERDFQYALIEIDAIRNATSYDPGAFIFTPNNDGSKLVIVQNIPGIKKGKSLLGLSLFNEKLEKISTKGIVLPYDRNMIDFEQVISNSKGDIAMLLKVYLPRKEIKPGNEDHIYHLVTLKHGESEVKDHKITIPNKRVKHVSILFNQREEIMLLGFIGNESSKGITGTVYGTFNFDGEQINRLNETLFPSNILQHFTPEKYINRGEGVQGISIDKVFLKSNGGIYVISEQYHIERVCNRDARGTLACNYYYYYNSILVHSIAENGEYEWTKVIPKYQSSIDDGGIYSSYAAAFKNDTLFFVFNEHEKNFEQTDPSKLRVMLRPNKAVLALSIMTPDGNVSKTPLINNKTENNKARPRFYYTDKNAQLIIPANELQSNKFKLIRIEF